VDGVAVELGDQECALVGRDPDPVGAPRELGRHLAVKGARREAPHQHRARFCVENRAVAQDDKVVGLRALGDLGFSPRARIPRVDAAVTARAAVEPAIGSEGDAIGAAGGGINERLSARRAIHPEKLPAWHVGEVKVPVCIPRHTLGELVAGRDYLPVGAGGEDEVGRGDGGAGEAEREDKEERGGKEAGRHRRSEAIRVAEGNAFQLGRQPEGSVRAGLNRGWVSSATGPELR
jgi:hypothetical protein